MTALIHYRRLALVAGALALLAVAILLSVHARADSPRLVTATLYEGLNVVGWTGEELSVADFAATMPTQPQTIYIRKASGGWQRWSPHVPARQNTLRTVSTGAVVRVRMGTMPIGPWVVDQADEIPPTEIGPELSRGRYEIVWHEPGETRVADIVRGLGDALERVWYWDAPSKLWRTSPMGRTVELGDVLSLQISSPVYWARPTDAPTNIVWLGEVSDERRAQVQSAIDEARDWFADEYGVETADFTLYYGDEIDAIVSGYRRHERDWFDDGTEDWWRRDLAQTNGGIAHQQFDHIVFAGEVWGGGQHQLRRASVAHYWPILRALLADHLGSSDAWHRGNGRVPAWLRGDRDFLRERFYGDYARARSEWLEHAAKTSVSLSSSETGDGWNNLHWQVRQGLSGLAVEWLTARAGDDAVVEFWRQLRHHDRWQDAFRAAYGIGASEFYRRYEAWRADGFPAQQSAETRMISGRVQGPGGDPLAEFTLHACPEDARSGDCIDAETDANGRYEFSLPADRYMISAVIEAEGCTVARNYDGRWRDLTDAWSSHSLIDVREGSVDGRDIHLSALPGSAESAAWCDRGRPDYFDVEFVSFTGRLTGPDGPIGGVHIHACLDPDYQGTPSGSCYAGVTAANGDFHINLPANATYQLSIEPTWSRCQTHGWYANAGPTDNRDRARSFTVQGDDVDGVDLRLPDLPAALEVFNPC